MAFLVNDLRPRGSFFLADYTATSSVWTEDETKALAFAIFSDAKTWIDAHISMGDVRVVASA